MSDLKFCGRNNSPSRKRTVGIVDVKVFLKFTSTCKKKFTYNYMSTGHVIIPQETSCKGCNVFNHHSFSPGFFGLL